MSNSASTPSQAATVPAADGYAEKLVLAVCEAAWIIGVDDQAIEREVVHWVWRSKRCARVGLGVLKFRCQDLEKLGAGQMTVFTSAYQSFKQGFNEGWAMFWSPLVALAEHFRVAASVLLGRRNSGKRHD